ncbi:hypothetical protein ACLOJK_014198 [Asimina triloba]
MANSEANSRVSVSGAVGDGGENEGEAVAISEEVVASHVEEASPDSLKNTPTNIARLEDVIEQCKGRQKYHTRTRSPSDGEDIRWYFCKIPLAQDQLAASVPQAEIVGKSAYFRFGMRDSLALEASFLQREEELLYAWWKEYAECSDGPNGSNIPSGVTSDSQPKLSCSEASIPTQPYVEERVGVPVKGGLYEVDLARRHCFPVYWSGENRRVLRGHWFARKNGLDWLPLREDIAEQLEFAYRCQIWHRRTFQPSGLFAARVDIQGTTQGLHALFTGEDDTWEAWLVIDTSGFSHVIGLGGKGIKLRRGFSTSGSLKPTQDELRQQKEEEMDDYCSQVPVRHLVFMVHGIGQRLEKANLVDDVGDFRHLTANLAERHLTSYQRIAQRVLFIPCQWRRGLKLSGESAVEDITLDGVRGLRVMLSATVHDVLYYMSPIYCQDIIDSVSNQLNRLYMKFIKRNPGYDGKSLPAEYIENEESVRANNQPSRSEKKNNHGNGETSNELANVIGGEDSNPQPSIMVNDENSTNHSVSIDSSPALDLEGNSSKTCDDQSLDESRVYYNQTTDSSELQEEQLVKDSQKVELSSSNMFSQDGKSSGVDIGTISQIPDGDGKILAEDVNDKDELINSLRKEVNALKARIVELETIDSSLISSGGWKYTVTDSIQVILVKLIHCMMVGDKMDKDAARQSLSEKPSSSKNYSGKSYTPHIRYTKLEFKADTFFAVGSPLGVFLALRNIRFGIDALRGRVSISDIGLITAIRFIQYYFGYHIPFDFTVMQEFREDLASHSQAIVTSLNVMKDKTFEHPYIQAIGAHTNYWRDPDTALFILKHLYRDIPEEADIPDRHSSPGSSSNRKGPTGPSYQSDDIDEDLPLTFSDKSLIREFSRKVRKVTRHNGHASICEICEGWGAALEVGTM